MKHETAKYVSKYLTDTIFETGAYRVPNKCQNPTVLGQVTNGHSLTGFVRGALCLAKYNGYSQIRRNTQNQVMLPATLGF